MTSRISNESSSPLPRRLEELSPHLDSLDATRALLDRITERGRITAWARFNPLCARRLATAILCQENLKDAITPFFSLCASDPDFEETLCKISDPSVQEVCSRLEEKATLIAEHPKLFFQLFLNLIEKKNHRLLLCLIDAWKERPTLAEGNKNEIKEIIIRAIYNEDDRIIDELLSARLLENDTRLGVVLISQAIAKPSERCLEICFAHKIHEKIALFQVSTQLLNNSPVAELVAANGVSIEEPTHSRTLTEYRSSFSSWSDSRELPDYKVEAARSLGRLRKRLYSEETSEEKLSQEGTSQLIRWVTLDQSAEVVLKKHPRFFRNLLFQSPSEILLQKCIRAEIFSIAEEGGLLLFKAIEMGDVSLTSSLLRLGAACNHTDPKTGLVPLHFAIVRCLPSYAMWEILLNHPEIDCNIPLPDGSHPLEALLKNPSAECQHIQKMLEKGNCLPFCHTLSLLDRIVKAKNPKDIEILKLLIAHGISFQEKTGEGENALHLLVRACRTYPKIQEVLEMMCFSGAVALLNERNHQGITPLDLAITLDLPEEVVLLFLQAGAPPPSISCGNPILSSVISAYFPQKMPASPKELSEWLTLKNLAHLFGDAISKKQRSATSGIDLEGNPFPTSLQFICALLSLCGEIEETGKIQKTIPLAILLNQCLIDPEFSARIFPILCKVVHAQTQWLGLGESLLLPIGWNEHAMLLKIRRETKETYSLAIVNTGAGTDLHAANPTDLKTKIDPLLIFPVAAKEQLLESDFFASLFSPNIKIPSENKHKYQAKEIYHLFFSRFTNPEVGLHEITVSGQRSGTCSLRVLLAYLHTCLGSERYKRLKGLMDFIVFTALNDPSFLQMASIDETFMTQLNHAVERSALNRLKLPGGGEVAELLTEMQMILPPPQQAISTLPLQDCGSSEPHLQTTLNALGTITAAAPPIRNETEALSPCKSISLPATGQPLVETIDGLIKLFKKSEKNPLDDQLYVATRFTTEALMALALPASGVYTSEIDLNTPFGALTSAQKRQLKEKIEILAKHYATAYYKQKNSAENKAGGQRSKVTDPVGAEGWVCMNKLFAIHWRLTLALDETGTLREYGIDIAHLTSLQKGIHLRCYSYDTVEQIEKLISFFTESHPAPGISGRTLLAVGGWADEEGKISLPLNESFGEASLYKEIYRSIEEGQWSESDRARINLQVYDTRGLFWRRCEAWELPSQEAWRLATLFIRSEAPTSSSSSSSTHTPTAPSDYDTLREMALLCWLFFERSSEEPLSFPPLKWDREKHILSTSIKSKVKTVNEPSQFAERAHLPIEMQDAKNALRGNNTQNYYLVHRQRSTHPLYDIAKCSSLSLDRLLVYFRDHTPLLKEKDHLIFFQLILFGHEGIHKNPEAIHRALHVIEQALSSFFVELQADPARKELYRTIILLHFIKMRLLPEAQLTQSLPPAPSAPLRALRHFLSILETPDPVEMLLHLAEAERFLSESNEHFLEIEPALEQQAHRKIFLHLNALQAAFENQELLKSTTLRILNHYGVAVDPDTKVMGNFPQTALFHNGHLYELNLLNGVILCDKAPLKNAHTLHNNPIYQEFSAKRNIHSLSLISSTASKKCFQGICDGKSVHFTLTDKLEIHMQVHDATFQFIPSANAPESLKQIAIQGTPAYWISRSPTPIAAIIEESEKNREEVLLLTDGTARRHGKEGQWQYLRAETVPLIAPLLSLQSPKDIAVWEGPVEEVDCFGLVNSEGKHIVFRERHATPNFPGFFLSANASINGVRKQFPYAILENMRGEKRALVPVKTLSELHNPHTDTKKAYLVEAIPLNRKGHLEPKEVKQNLLLAYYFLGARQYERALGFLKKAESSGVYSPEELQLLAWIFLHHKQTKDHSPKALALRLMAAHMAQENLRKNPSAYPSEGKEISISDFYSNPSSWAHFWKGNAHWKKSEKEKRSVHHFLAKALSSYYKVSAHCKRDFQIHENLLSPFQEAEWLKEILSHVRCRELQSRLIFLTTGISPPPIEVTSLPYPAPIAPFDVSKKANWMSFLAFFSPRKEGSLTLADLNRVRPEEGLKKAFGNLYRMTKTTARNQVQRFLDDMAYDPDPINQAIRAILLSQLPPYHRSPESIAIATILDKLGKEQASAPKKSSSRMSTTSWLTRPTQPGKASDNGENEKQLLQALVNWCAKYGSSESNPLPNAQGSVDTSSLLPQLSQAKHEKLSLQTLEKREELIEILTTTADRYFTPLEAPRSTSQLLPLPSALEGNLFYQRQSHALRSDLQAAISQNQMRKRHQLKGEELPPLKESLEEIANGLKSELKILKKEILKMVMNVEEGREIQAQLERLGKKEIPPTLDECIALFVQKDSLLYQKRLPFLSPSDRTALHEMIGQYLQGATSLQRYNRVLKQMNRVIQKGKSPHLLAEEMKKKREYDPSLYPEMMVFEYYANISLRKEQCENLIKMTTVDSSGRFPPMIVQMIMSAGKTFVLGTLLALMKADGYHLSMLFLPSSLLETNAADLKERTNGFFGQRGHTITFGRGEEYFNPFFLRRLYHDLIETINRREYITLAVETIESMQNQYIEAREKIYSLKRKERTPAIENEIDTLQVSARELKRILHLFRTRGAGTLDEIDSQYSPRREHNFPGINTKHLDQGSIKLVSRLYEIASTDPELQMLGLDLKSNTQSRLLPHQIDAIKRKLTEKMTSAIAGTPLFWEQIGIGENSFLKLQSFEEYLLNPLSDPPEWINALGNSPIEKERNAAERLILIRQEILSWLPSCWKSTADEHFSRSRAHPEYLAAKPNICASTPNEKAEIAHPWELVNKTLQLYVSNGVDTAQAAAIVQLLQSVALLQLRSMQIGSHIEQTPAAQQFKKAVLEKHLLFQVNTQDPQQMLSVQKALNSGSKEAIQTILHYLNEQVFPQLKFPIEQIHNNTSNLSFALASLQGYSGTGTENPFIFPHIFLQNPSETILLEAGANGRVADVLLQNNRTLHRAPAGAKTPEQLMHALEQPDRNAFINVGAYFKEYTNAENAQSFLSYFSSIADSPIEAVLYYDDATSKLVCIRKGSEHSPIILTGTDPKSIYASTSLKPHQLFTYYDPFHTRGSNILQHDGAKAFYTIGDQTTLRDTFQAVMRMRGLLEGRHHVEGIISEDLIPFISHCIHQEIEHCPDIEQLLLYLEINGLAADQEDNIKAQPIKLEARVRGEVYDTFFTSTEEEEERLYADARPFFIKSIEEDLFLHYAKGTTPIDLETYITRQIHQLFTKLQPVEGHLSTENADRLKEDLAETAHSSKEHLPSHIQSPPSLQNCSVENVSVIENEADTLNELELNTQRILASSAYPREAKETKWILGTGESILDQLIAHTASNKPLPIRPFVDAMSSLFEYANYTNCFTPQILVTENFLQTEEGKCNLFEPQQKRAHEALLFFGHGEIPYLLLVSTDEAEVLYTLLRDHPTPLPLWLVNSDGDKSVGTSVDTPQIQDLLIQFLFLGGRFSAMQQARWQQPLTAYLSQGLTQKRELFESTLLPKEHLYEYAGSDLETALNAPSTRQIVENHALYTLTTALLHLRNERFAKCMQIVQKMVPTVLEEGNEEALIPLIEIAGFTLERTASTKQSEWAASLLTQITPLIKRGAQAGRFAALLNRNIPDLIKEEIASTLISMDGLPEETLKAALKQKITLNLIDNPECSVVIRKLRKALHLSERNALALQMLSEELCSWTNRRNPLLFEAIIDLMRTEEPSRARQLESIATPFLREFFLEKKETLSSYLNGLRHSPICPLTNEEKRTCEWMADLNGKLYGISETLDGMIRQSIIEPLRIRCLNSNGSLTKNPKDEIDILLSTQIPLAIEMAENLRYLQPSRSY